MIFLNYTLKLLFFQYIASCASCGHKLKIQSDLFGFFTGVAGLVLGSTTQKPRFDAAFATRLGHSGSDVPPPHHLLPLSSSPYYRNFCQTKKVRDAYPLCLAHPFKIDPYRKFFRNRSMVFSQRIDLSLGDDGSCT